MAFLDDLLEYQKVDGELRRVEQQLASSDERKKFVQAKNGVKNAETRIAEEDARAVEIRKLRDAIAARVEEAGKAVDEYADIDELVEREGGDVSFYKRNAQQLAEKLRAAKAELSRLAAEADALFEEYGKMMEQGKKMMALYKEYSEKFRVLQEARAGETGEIEKRLKELAKKIPADLLERYQQKRREHIYPVIVPLSGDTCMCGMDLSIAQKGKLENGEILECEHCHRLICKR